MVTCPPCPPPSPPPPPLLRTLCSYLWISSCTSLTHTYITGSQARPSHCQGIDASTASPDVWRYAHGARQAPKCALEHRYCDRTINRRVLAAKGSVYFRRRKNMSAVIMPGSNVAQENPTKRERKMPSMYRWRHSRRALTRSQGESNVSLRHYEAYRDGKRGIHHADVIGP